MRPSCVAWPGSRQGLETSASSTGAATSPWPRTQPALWALRPGSILRTNPWRLSRIRSGTTSPWAMAEPRPQVALSSIWSSAVRLPFCAGTRGSACFGRQPEETFELPREGGAGAILDQRRGAHDGEPLRRDRAPRGEQRGQHRCGDRALIKREPDLNGEPARVGQIGRRDALRLIGEAEFNELHAIGLGVEAEAARRRQAGPAQAREIRRLGAEPLGVHGLRVVEGNQKVHTALR